MTRERVGDWARGVGLHFNTTSHFLISTCQRQVVLYCTCHSGVVVSASDSSVGVQGSKHAAGSCVYRDSRCNMQPWARAAHLYCSA